MTVSSRPRLVARFAANALVVSFVVSFVGLVSSGCEDKHIGRRCDLTISGAGGEMAGAVSATINSQAVECPSRLCLQPAQEQPTTVGPLCTAECGSDDDCSDGQMGAPGSGLCEHGFKCAIPTTVGDFCCKKMCVCKDFLVIPQGGLKTPPVCMPGSGGNCKNVH
jgi:hypothetical protein